MGCLLRLLKMLESLFMMMIEVPEDLVSKKKRVGRGARKNELQRFKAAGKRNTRRDRMLFHKQSFFGPVHDCLSLMSAEYGVLALSCLNIVLNTNLLNRSRFATDFYRMLASRGHEAWSNCP